MVQLFLQACEINCFLSIIIVIFFGLFIHFLVCFINLSIYSFIYWPSCLINERKYRDC